MEESAPEPEAVLARAVESDRVHSAYLLSGPAPAPRETARAFARALGCARPRAGRACEACPGCRRSGADGEAIALDGAGRKGPLLRHVGDHPDLLWVERGADDTRVRIGQVRALQAALRLRGTEGGRRAAVVADAEWLNQEAQNALLRLLEEPPPATTVILVAASPAGLAVTVRSRCQRLAFRQRPEADEPDPQEAELRGRLEALAGADLPSLLDWAEEMRGPRARAAADTGQLLGVASRWLHRRTCDAVLEGRGDPRPALDAFRTLQACRKALVQRNANPQMVAERALLAIREALLS